jgi:anaerobic magnesium-protoporphyrin IX monomethyl ester cyclase
VKELVFMDDIFNFKPERAKAIARGIIARGYKLALTFPNGFRGDILDEELVVLLKQAGMYRCMVAVESASPRIQKVMKKNLKIDKVERIVDFIAKQGVMVHGAFMLGFPTETEKPRCSRDDRLGRERSFHTAAFFRVIPFKGTELFKEVETRGLRAADDWSAYEPYQSEINLSAVPRAILEAAQVRLPALLLQPARLWRIFNLIPNKTNMLPFLTLLFARRAYAR